MSWSLQIRNGDLSVSGAKLGVVTGGSKLAQDLRCALLTERGSDDLHPTFGSLIDGGRNDAGDWVPSLIGSTDWELIAMRVEAEIRRICLEQQARQVSRSQADRMVYGRSTLSNDELLLQVDRVQMFQAMDSLMVRVSITTGSGQTQTVDVAVSDQAPITT
jgi:hypothetical protein